MPQKNELDKALDLWGSIKTPISRKSIESWGRIESGSVINLYRMLSRDLGAAGPMTRKHRTRRNAAQRVAGLHPGAIWASEDFDEPLPDEFWTGEA